MGRESSQKGALTMKSTLLTKTSILFLLLVFMGVIQSTVAQTDVILAVDLSGTMTRNDPRGLRYVGADQFFTIMSASGGQGDRAGIVVIGNDARVLMPLDEISLDKSGKYQSMLRQTELEDWTEIGLGLELCRSILQRSGGTAKRIILVSDGIVEGNPHVRGMSRAAAAKEAEGELWSSILPALRRAGVRVYTVGLAEHDSKGEITLKKIADATGGFYRRVDRAEQFGDIYLSIYKQILSSAAVLPVSVSNPSLWLNLFDDALVVKAPTGFSVVGPEEIVYKPTTDIESSPVKFRWLTYPDGNSLLFLFRPADTARDARLWSGQWRIQDLSGSGQAFIFSAVTLEFNIRLREKYFINEYFSIEADIKLTDRQGRALPELLTQSAGKYTIVSLDNPEVSPKSGKLEKKPMRQQVKFEGETLINQPGSYMLQVELVDPKIPRTREAPFNVTPDTLFWIEIKTRNGKATLGEKYQVVGHQNFHVFEDPESNMRGLRNSYMDVTIHYDSGEEEHLTEISQTGDGPYLSPEREILTTGGIEVTATLSGELVSQDRTTGGLKYQPAKLFSHTEMYIQEYLWDRVKRILDILWYIIECVLFLHVMVGVVRWIRGKQLSASKLVGGERGIASFPDWDEKPTLEKIKRSLLLKNTYSIGGTQSSAEIKIMNARDKIVAKIGKTIFGNYYIIRTGEAKIELGSIVGSLEPNKRYRIILGEEITIDNVGPFTFKD